MAFRRIVPFALIVFTLTGCFRQAEDTFDTVDSQGATTNIGITQIVETLTTTPEVMIIDPNATSTPVLELPAESTQTEVAASPTVRIIQPTASSTPTNIPLPATQQQLDVLPTATEQKIVTPDTGPVQQVIASATPTQRTVSGQTSNGLPPTPTALPGTEGGECEYVIQSGDNLFRIALNNEVSLEDLLSVNGLSEQSVIQPGQVLTIPGCTAEGSDAESTEESIVTEPTTSVEDGQIVHVVASGETLLTIARRYGVTVNAIVGANSLSDPNRLDVGQELIIPQQ
jgi:LysM repeat protein